jgi:calcineurin-like phosphoesterase family protein
VAESSRESTAGAGWQCEPGRFAQLVPRSAKPFSWLSPRPLWQSRNDRLARVFGDPTDDRRRAWMAKLAPADPDLLVDLSDRDPVAFLVAGDTGEGDGSQFAVAEPLLSRAQDTTFLFVCSDVVYPAGGIDAYRDKLFLPYTAYRGPIYAVPGNHDWYDDATGFMYWFCGAEEAPPRPRSRPPSKAWIRDRLWRRAPRSHAETIREARELRPETDQQFRQPAPYLAIDVGRFRLIGIDTGITGSVDREQGAWLRRMSQGPRPKVLLTGKPIYVDGERREGRIEGGGTIDEIVTHPDHHYIAAIGGDIHNYQRYPVALPDGRTIVYLVAGGGGAFMHETYSIPSLDDRGLEGVTESGFRCYPLRGDCLSRFSQLYAHKLRLIGGRLLYVPPDQAAAIMSKRLGIPATRPGAQATRPTRRARIAAAIILWLPGRGRRGLHLPFSEWLDWNQPPMFKSFLRFDAAGDELTIHCFAATGCASQQDDPPVEDVLRASPGDDGRWQWSFE